MRIFSLIVTLLMLSLGSPMARGQAVINQELGTYVSEPGESLDAFILRTAPVLDAFTAKKEWEACAAIAKSHEGDRFGFVLTTSQAMLGCLVYTDMLPEGMVFSGMNFHSHPGTPDIYPTYMDQQLLNMRGLRGQVRAGDRNAGRRGFSKDDFEAGPGYLVAGGRVFYQAGLKTVREVGKLSEPARNRSFPRR